MKSDENELYEDVYYHNNSVPQNNNAFHSHYNQINIDENKLEPSSPIHLQRINPSENCSFCSAALDSPKSSPIKPRRFATKRFHNIWSAIKRFSPVHRIKDNTSNKKQKLIVDVKRLCASHPDISSCDLVGLAQVKPRKSRDDMDLILSKSRKIKNSLISTFCDNGFMQEKLNRAQSQEDKTSKDDLTDMEKESNFKDNKEFPQHPFYLLEVHLNCAKNLLAKDSCGTSDPYVKFRIGNKMVYKSKTVPKCLDPKWDEYFIIPIDDVFEPILLQAYDYDFMSQDDFLGSATINLTKLELGSPKRLVLTLTETGDENESLDQSWGEVFLTVTLVPKTQEDKDQYFRRAFRGIISSTGTDSIKKSKTQLWDSAVNIVLVEGRNLMSKDDNEISDAYVKFRLGNEKYKSKNIPKSLNPVWSEQFDLHTYTDQSKVLEIFVCDFHSRDDYEGKCTINLNELAKEETHKIWKDLGEGTGEILLLVTISGTLGSDAISDLNTYIPDPKQEKSIARKYGYLNTFRSLDDIGMLTVKVFKAEGVAAADLGGTSDPFCVLELVNSRLQTNTEYKTLTPEWNKIFTFQVKDVHSVLEITVYDEDRDKKVEFLGKIAIPLLKIKSGEKKWYALKDKKLMTKTKGQILLENHLVYNPIKASIRTFNPREKKFMKPEQKFKRTLFVRNVTRLKTILMEIFEVAKYINSCFQWESIPRSITAFIIFLITTFFFELYMVPIVLLSFFVKNYLWISIRNYFIPSLKEEEIDEDEDFMDDDDDETRNEEKKTLKEKLQTVQDISTMIQNVIGEIASCGERIKNTFDFSVPFLSWLAIIVLTFASVILYYIPLRYLIMAWGINKFTKKIRSPNSIPNNELLDFLSRVPDHDEKIMYREYKLSSNLTLNNTSDSNDKRKKKKA